jgi:hypothetical protein
MTRRTLRYLLAALAALVLPGRAPAGDLGPLEPLADLHRAVHEELGLPEPLIVRLLEAGAPDEQLPVLGHLARELGQTPERIFELHRSGLSFLDITLRFGRGPEIFYVPLAVDPGPPYGKAWGYFKKTPRARWNTIRLTDVEVIDLVNLRVAADHYRVAPERIIELRRAGKPFRDIHRAFAAETGRHGRPPAAGDGGHGHGKPGDKPDKRRDKQPDDKPGRPPRG